MWGRLKQIVPRHVWRHSLGAGFSWSRFGGILLEQGRRHSPGAGFLAYYWRASYGLIAGTAAGRCVSETCSEIKSCRGKAELSSSTSCYVIMSRHVVMSCRHAMSSCHVLWSCQGIMSCHHVTPCAHVMSSYHVIIPCHVIMSCHHVTPCGHVMPSCHVITPCHVVMSSCHVPSCVCPRVVYVYDHMARQLQVNTEPVYVSVCFDQACLCLCVCPRVCALVWCRSYGGGGGGPRVRKLRGHW